MCDLMKLPSPPTAVLALNLGISTGVLLDRIDNLRQLAYTSLDETELSEDSISQRSSAARKKSAGRLPSSLSPGSLNRNNPYAP